MIRTVALFTFVAFTAACQPAPTPAESAAAAGNPTVPGMPGVAPNVSASDLAQAMEMAKALNPDLSAEDRAKLDAVSGALATGQSDPNAAAWLAGANQTFDILATVRDVPSANAAKAKLAPIYAQMAGPAAALKAMDEDKRDVAFGSTLPQYMAIAPKAASVMMALNGNIEVQRIVSELLDEMPNP